MQLKTLTKPAPMLALVLVLHVVLGLLFSIGLLPSFSLDSENVSFWGLLLYFAFFACLFVILLGLTREEKAGVDRLNETIGKIDYGRLNLVVVVLIVISVVGCIRIFTITIEQYSLADYLLACVQNTVKSSSDLSDGPYHIFIIFPMVLAPLVVLAATRIPHWQAKLVVTLLAAAYLGTVFGSRLVLFETAFAAVVLLIRVRYNENEIKVRTLVVGIGLVVIAAVVFVVVSGYRDYQNGGQLYTDSPIIWGVSRALDYPLSTAIYASHALELLNSSFSIGNIFPTLERILPDELLPSSGLSSDAFRAAYGQTYYTNTSGLGELLGCGGYLAPIIAVFVIALIAFFYRRFRQGDIYGLLIYPYFLYATFELWRTFHFFYEIFQVTVVVLAFCAWFILRRASRDLRS